VRGFGDLEAAIMDVVWSAPDDDGLLVRDVLARLNEDRHLAYTSVQTVMDILYRKGWLTREKDGRAYRYWATASRDEYTASLLGQALESSESRTGALMRLIEQMSPREVRELRAALEEIKPRRRRR
jgi:predicted transcriptional regulator